ncbi:hypothetical protein [Bacteroides sp.]|uniref:hypothetical protein n=1 Tax=Bacteroides sp. TaxID=29523 RepID=UPI0025B916AF|nr:hypothetical protein [Bacteroides sp.]
MRKIAMTLTCSLFSLMVQAQVPFVTYEAVPTPNVSVPRYNTSPPRTREVPSISIVNSEIITTNALCLQGEEDSFTIGTKVMIKQFSNGVMTLGLIGIKRGNQWKNLDEVKLISISEAIAHANSSEEKESLLNISEFKYFAILGESCMLLFK